MNEAHHTSRLYVQSEIARGRRKALRLPEVVPELQLPAMRRPRVPVEAVQPQPKVTVMFPFFRRPVFWFIVLSYALGAVIASIETVWVQGGAGLLVGAIAALFAMTRDAKK